MASHRQMVRDAVLRLGRMHIMNPRILFSLFALFTTAIATAADLSDTAIIREVLDTNTRMQAAGNALNAEDFFAFITDDATIVQSGRVLPNREAALAEVKAGFERMQQIERVFENPQVIILSTESALLVSEGRFSATLNDGRTISGRFAVSLVFVRTNGGWKVRHGHYSAPPAPN